MRVVSQERFIAEALKAHNIYRDIHRVPGLEHDSRLSSLAKEWAENLAEKGTIEYRNTTYKGVEVGENIMRLKLGDSGLYYYAGKCAT